MSEPVYTDVIRRVIHGDGWRHTVCEREDGMITLTYEEAKDKTYTEVCSIHLLAGETAMQVARAIEVLNAEIRDRDKK